MTVFVGGVSELFQGDLDLGRRAAEMLSVEQLGSHVVVEDLHYGAVSVVHRLNDLTPTTMILVGATERGRAPGTVDRTLVGPLTLTPAQTQAAVGDAVVGYVSLDLVVQVAFGLKALPPRTVLVDVEPAEIGPCDRLSSIGERALQRAVRMVRTEVHRTPLMELAETLRSLCTGDRLEPVPAVEVMIDLLRELEQLDGGGSWGSAFRERDRLRLRISEGQTGEGMDHLDWGLWWALIEEIDRLQQTEAVEGLY